jgi:hypothetical protein
LTVLSGSKDPGGGGSGRFRAYNRANFHISRCCSSFFNYQMAHPLTFLGVYC